MQVQLICRSDKDPEQKAQLEIPFEFFGHDLHLSQVILVPSLEHYHEVQGQLLLHGVIAKVVCILPPSRYEPMVGQVPYALVTDDYIPVCDPLFNSDEMFIAFSYYFTEKKQD